jgi:hypothetical protein
LPGRDRPDEAGELAGAGNDDLLVGLAAAGHPLPALVEALLAAPGAFDHDRVLATLAAAELRAVAAATGKAVTRPPAKAPITPPAAAAATTGTVTRHPPPRRIPLPSGPTAFPERAASSSLSIVLARANCGPAHRTPTATTDG